MPRRTPRGLLFLALGLLLPGAGCSPQKQNALLVGMELNYPPFEMVDPRGQPSGISVELAEALLAVLTTVMVGSNERVSSDFDQT